MEKRTMTGTAGAGRRTDAGGAKRGRRPAQRARASSRERIERAALELFAAEGIDAATTRAIAAGAGVSEGAIYRHYPSKAAVAEALFASVHERLARLVREAGESGATIEEQAGAVVDAYCRTADEDWTLFSFHLLSTAHFLPSPPGEDNPVAAVEAIVGRAMARGEIPFDNAGFVAAMALGVVLQPALHKAHGRIAGPLSPRRKALKRAVMAVLRSVD